MQNAHGCKPRLRSDIAVKFDDTNQPRRCCMRFRSSSFLLAFIFFVPAVAIRTSSCTALADTHPDTTDTDTDGDGLSDFHEVHKYQSDPKKTDTAGNGVFDGEPKQRREFAYSVRAVIRVMPPYNL